MMLSLVATELQKPVRRASVPLPMGNALGRGVLRTLGRLVVPNVKKLQGITLVVRGELQPSIRIYLPRVRQSEAALLWIHGGGFVLGNAALDDRFCAVTAKTLGIVVVSVDYRLAPEHPFPVPLDDCHAAWLWVQKNAGDLGIDPKQVAIGGQSAGGALAASLVQRLQDEAGNKPAAQWLFCPMLDDHTATRRDLDAVNHFVWNNRANTTGWRLYLAREPGSAALPSYAAPARRENLLGLPPTWIGAGEVDLLHAEARAYADRLQASGVETVFASAPGAPHGFESWAFDTKIAQDFIAGAQQWLRRHLQQRA